MPEKKTSNVSYDELTGELRGSVLTKVSPRDLLACTKVCRSWQAIIRDGPSFPYMHIKHSRQASISDHSAGLIIVGADYDAFMYCSQHSQEFYRSRRVTIGGIGYTAVTSCDWLILISTSYNLNDIMESGRHRKGEARVFLLITGICFHGKEIWWWGWAALNMITNTTITRWFCFTRLQVFF